MGPCLTYLRPISDNTKREDNTSSWIFTGNSTLLDPHFIRGDKIDTFDINSVPSVVITVRLKDSISPKRNPHTNNNGSFKKFPAPRRKRNRYIRERTYLICPVFTPSNTLPRTSGTALIR